VSWVLPVPGRVPAVEPGPPSAAVRPGAGPVAESWVSAAAPSTGITGFGAGATTGFGAGGGGMKGLGAGAITGLGAAAIGALGAAAGLAAGLAGAFFRVAFFLGAAALRATFRRTALRAAAFLPTFRRRAGLRAAALALPTLRCFLSFRSFFLSFFFCFRPFASPFDFPFFLRFAMAAPWKIVMPKPPRRRAVGMTLRSTQSTPARKSRVRHRRTDRAAPQQAAAREPRRQPARKIR
jgi:hypothetical protein